MPNLASRVARAAQHPVAVGLAAIALVAVVILVVGTRVSRADFLKLTRTQQSRQLDYLAQAIHYGPLEGVHREGLRDDFARLAATAEFDSFIRRSLFGMDVEKLDIYALDGSVLYSTDPASTGPAAATDSLLQEARRGNPASALVSGAEFTDLDGRPRSGQVMQTYGLVLDAPPDAGASGRPMAILALQRDIGSRLESVTRTVWSVTVVFFGGLASVLVIVHRVSDRSRRRLQRANEELQHREAAVRESRQRMVRADEAAKRAISEELHGTVQTKLFAVWMRLGLVRDGIAEDRPEVAASLGKLIDDVDQIREGDIRQLSHRLHPSIVRVSALAGLRSLRDFYEDIVPVELTVTDSATRLEKDGVSTIPENTRLAVYRIADLALTNVAKHASADRCDITWDYLPEEERLVLTVADDGVGFAAGSAAADEGPGSLGLVTMSDYADALEGTFSIESRPGAGTRVEVRIPFRAEPESEPEAIVDTMPDTSGAAGDEDRARTAHTAALPDSASAR